MEIKNDELKKVYGVTTSGNYFSLQMEVFLKIDREITDTDKEKITYYSELLREFLVEESIRLNPQSIEKAKLEKSELLNLFSAYSIFVEEIPNEYCNAWCCKHLPWFIITTKKGRIKIGWRSRVINIDWADSIIQNGAKDLFKDEEVTKGEKFIHAWGIEKAQEYIDILLK